MLTLSSITPIDPPVLICKVKSLDELEDKIYACSQTCFTGWLVLDCGETDAPNWKLFFRWGRFIGGVGGTHSLRRWYRQIVQHCPQLVKHSGPPPDSQIQYWDQTALIELVKQRQISYEQMVAVIEGNLIEVLFDMIQTEKQDQYRSGTQLIYRDLPEKLLKTRSVLISTEQVWRRARQQWQTWQQAGLEAWSPDLAPVIWDAEELRQQTSLLAYHHLTRMANGEYTLRDIAIKLKQPLVPLTLSIMPYVQKGIMGLIQVKDWPCLGQAFPQIPDSAVTETPFMQPIALKETNSLVAYIEDSRFDCMAMSQILATAGYRFINVRDPVQALPILLEQKPSLIFLDLLMPVTNGYEVCAQIRRISAFKDTPIVIVTSSDGIVDRVRAKLVGSSGFISKPIEREQVLAVLRTHLPKSA